MARPTKVRRVCDLPETDLFGPLNKRPFAIENNHINMTVEEYETIRLIDKEGLMQEECAERMGVARTTVQTIYISARKNLADAIVDGITLKIEGGSYAVCDGDCDHDHVHCGRRGRHKRQFKNRQMRGKEY